MQKINNNKTIDYLEIHLDLIMFVLKFMKKFYRWNSYDMLSVVLISVPIKISIC